MRQAAVVLAGLMLAVICASGAGAEFPERWVYGDVNFLNDQQVDEFLAVMRKAREAGANTINFKDPQFAFIEMCPENYHRNIARTKALAEELSLKVIPTVYPFGYSGGYLVQDMNLAAGLPAREVPFVVKGGVAMPDPAVVPPLKNLGFEEAEGDKFAGWEGQDFAGAQTFADKDAKHSGAAALKITNVENMVMPEQPAGGFRQRGRSCRLVQTVPVKPFQYYHVTLWVKSDKAEAEAEDFLVITSADERRRLSYTNLGVQPTQDWTLHDVTFNTLESTAIRFSVGMSSARGGTLWVDDVTVTPAGFSNLVRSATKPFVVTSADKKTVYEEGKDFEPVSDPNLGKDALELMYYLPFPSFRWHEAPGITLTKESRIKDGDTILASYFHPHRIYNDQITVSMEDPKVFELMEKQIANVHKAWNAPGYVMNYDEIRILGWEVQTDGAQLRPGQILAEHIKRGVEIAKKHAPNATFYTWSDMFTPQHNARRLETPGYYLCNGDFTGSWLGLPPEVVIMNWGGTGEWFAKRGHKQIIAGYYDRDAKGGVNRWLSRTMHLGNVMGMMYTTWQRKYDEIPDFFQAMKEWTPDTKVEEPPRRFE